MSFRPDSRLLARGALMAYRSVAVVLAGALLLAGVVVGIGPRLWGIANAHTQVPVVLPDFQPLSQRTEVYDTAGNTIAVFERENSQPITIDDVPEGVVDSLLAVEDAEYFHHHGVNLRGFVRALLSNFASSAPTQGASTITQQVVKNEYLAGLPRDGRYKALQAHYALMLENKLSKRKILERYFNTVFFGNNAYGLAAAAEVYFGKKASELTLLEGAFLMGLVRSPSGYDPIRYPEAARRRFKQVTTRLAAVGLITKDDAAYQAEHWPIPDQVRTLPTTNTKPTYYNLALKDYLLTKSDVLGTTEQERANQLYRGGLRIYTTLDPIAQQSAEKARNILPDTKVGFDAAVLSVDTTSGAIRAMVGGRGLRSDVPGGEVNMALVPRQTGSSIKSFILAAAFQAGAQPNDIIDGRVPCSVPDYVNGKPTEKIVKNGFGEVGPLNGPNTWKSTDCGYIRLSQAVGLPRLVDTVYRLAHSIYFYAGQPTSERVSFQPLGLLATGNNVMAPIDMAAGMQTIMNKGLHHDPYYVEKVVDGAGKVLYQHQDDGVQVIDERAALQTVDSLKGVIRSGTGARNLAKFPRPASGKTGTQFENTNAWFVGGTPQLTTAVWVGDPNGYTPMYRIPEFLKDGVAEGKVQGADYPAKIWGNFMENALVGQPALDWPPAPTPVRPPARIFVPGADCLATLVSGVLPSQPGLPAPSTSTTTTTTTIVTTASTVPGDTTPPPVTTTAPKPGKTVLQAVTPTTNKPDTVDPKAPVPTVFSDTYVYTCATPPPGIVIMK